jgi:hypothetical protein
MSQVTHGCKDMPLYVTAALTVPPSVKIATSTAFVIRIRCAYTQQCAPRSLLLPVYAEHGQSTRTEPSTGTGCPVHFSTLVHDHGL